MLRLEEIKELNANLGVAYALKEEFRLVYTISRSVRSAKLRLRPWRKTVKAFTIGALIRFAKEVERDFEEITAFFELRLTSGLIESFNNRMARLIHRVCGIKDLYQLEKQTGRMWAFFILGKCALRETIKTGLFSSLV